MSLEPIKIMVKIIHYMASIIFKFQKNLQVIIKVQIKTVILQKTRDKFMGPLV